MLLDFWKCWLKFKIKHFRKLIATISFFSELNYYVMIVGVRQDKNTKRSGNVISNCLNRYDQGIKNIPIALYIM